MSPPMVQVYPLESLFITIQYSDTAFSNITIIIVVTQAKVINLVSRTVLVVTMSTGFQIWSSDGSSLLFSLDPTTLNEKGDPIASAQCKGITSTGNYIYIGDGNGGITSLRLAEQFEVLPYSATSSGTGKSVGITCMHASDKLLSVGNEIGEVFCFDVSSSSPSPTTSFYEFQGTEFTATSICCRESVVVAAFSSGHIRIFKVFPDKVSRENELVVEIAAHSRCINALALHPTKYSFASCGEDGKLLIWDFDPTQFKINLVYSELMPHKLLTGATYLQDCKLAVSSYDRDALDIFEPSA